MYVHYVDRLCTYDVCDIYIYIYMCVCVCVMCARACVRACLLCYSVCTVFAHATKPKLDSNKICRVIKTELLFLIMPFLSPRARFSSRRTWSSAVGTHYADTHGESDCRYNLFISWKRRRIQRDYARLKPKINIF